MISAWLSCLNSIQSKDVDLGVTARYLLLILVLMGKISDIAGIASVDEKICYLVNNYDMVTVYFVHGIIIVLRK